MTRPSGSAWSGPLAVDDRFGCAGELPDDLGEPRGLVQWDERVAVFHLGQLAVREELGEALAVTRPGNSRRPASPLGDPADRR